MKKNMIKIEPTAPEPALTTFASLPLGATFVYSAYSTGTDWSNERSIHIKLNDNEQLNAVVLDCADLRHSGLTSFHRTNRWFFRGVDLSAKVGDFILPK